jgi:hypothetical protein
VSADGELVDEAVLAELAELYAKARDEANEATARKEEARDRILAIVGGAGKVVAGGYSLVVSEQTRVTLDSKALRAYAQSAGLDLSPFEKTSTSKVLRVT